jgi:endonuclease/exonuclease/phosphatase family metal-dependent hydrolase
MTIRYEFTDPSDIRVRTFLGKLVKAKDADDTRTVAARIVSMDVDVLAVQEVEDIDILKQFNRDQLGGLYREQILIEGNDPRFIDVGILSKLPIGAVTSFQTAVHPSDTSKRVFGRDLLEVELLNESRSKTLFTLYNNHLKSHFGDDDDGGAGKGRNGGRRTRQVEMVGTIVAGRMRTDARHVITGDMNDPPEAAPLAALLEIEGNAMVNALAHPVETRPAKPEADSHDPASPAWTHRFKPAHLPPQHELFDQIWLSPALAPSLRGAFIDRRTRHSGDGSDHDPAWVELDL